MSYGPVLKCNHNPSQTWQHPACCEPCHVAAPGGLLGAIQYPNNLCHSMPWSYYKLSLKLSGESVVLSVHRGFSLISRP